MAGVRSLADAFLATLVANPHPAELEDLKNLPPHVLRQLIENLVGELQKVKNGSEEYERYIANLRAALPLADLISIDKSLRYKFPNTPQLHKGHPWQQDASVESSELHRRIVGRWAPASKVPNDWSNVNTNDTNQIWHDYQYLVLDGASVTLHAHHDISTLDPVSNCSLFDKISNMLLDWHLRYMFDFEPKDLISVYTPGFANRHGYLLRHQDGSHALISMQYSRVWFFVRGTRDAANDLCPLLEILLGLRSSPNTTNWLHPSFVK